MSSHWVVLPNLTQWAVGDDNMKILYFGNFDSDIPTIDQEILYSLKKKAEVVEVDIREFVKDEDLKKIITKANQCDAFLFHALIPETQDFYVQLMLERLTAMLEAMTCKKVMWLLDKIVGSKMKIVTTLLPSVDYAFVTDGTWANRFESEKLVTLHPAATEKPIRKGRKNKEYMCDIAMVGSLYGERVKQYEFMKQKFGDNFKFFDDKYGKDYADICASAKVILVPQYPFDDFFWSERIYNTLALGGLCIHPRAYGLQEEGFIDGTHYIDYYTEQDLFVTLSMLLDKKSDKLRKGIAEQGKDFVKDKTYSQRIDKILEKVKPNQNDNETKSI